MPCQDLNGRHIITDICSRVEELKREWIDSGESRAGYEMDLTTYGHPLMAVSSFKYLGRVLSASDDDWPVVVSNTRKAHNDWASLSMVLGQEGVDTRTQGNFYMELVQVVILFGFYFWVMYQHIGRILGVFNQWMIR